MRFKGGFEGGEDGSIFEGFRAVRGGKRRGWFWNRKESREAVTKGVVMVIVVIIR